MCRYPFETIGGNTWKNRNIAVLLPDTGLSLIRLASQATVEGQEQDPRFIAFRDRLKGQTVALVDSGITDFYTRMAEGTDLWAGKAVLQLRWLLA